ncbi:hypothetical protein ABVT39_003691 [Epinephelus coioides]
MENKLAEITARIGNAESWLDFLEDANKAMEKEPPATKSEVDQLWCKIDDLENRARRNNLRFVGFPEGCKGWDALSFLRDNIPQLLELNFPGGIEIDQVHISNARRRPEGDIPPQAIITRFLKFQNREQITEATRRKGKVLWNGHHIMVFLDYSRLVAETRAKFNQCKQLLHERCIKFSLIYPATLVVKLPEGRREFDNPKKAAGFIHSLPLSSSSYF